MSYEIESKKRKFDRILETLTDRVALSRSSLNTRNNTNNNNASSISVNESHDASSAKKRRIGLGAPLSTTATPKNASTVSLVSQYLPLDREAFLLRLETFRQVTRWKIPSTEVINAAEWAKRGWVCAETNVVSCNVCRARLLVEIDNGDRLLEDGQEDEDVDEEDSAERDGSEDAQEKAGVYSEVVKKYQELIVDAHVENCPWRSRGCDSSIQRVEGLLNVSQALKGLRERYAGTCDNAGALPAVTSEDEEFDQYSATRKSFRFTDLDDLNQDALSLAVCGWSRKDDDVIECKHCFRSLGLWLYRGDDSAMERLDALESHLEYCPWLNPVAQDTELALPSPITANNKDSTTTSPVKRKIAAWELVTHAMNKDNIKAGRVIREQRPKTTSAETTSADNSNDLTPEQRDKKMKDLLKRIKDIKKPFNVKALLKKREKVAAG